MSLRVISGSARGRRLKKVPGDSTRPIMDRVKESLFNILRDEVAEARWLDLFAGTGQVGIEALSRGASEVVFIDTVRAAIKTIETNLEITKLSENAHIIKSDAFAYLERTSVLPFDLIYIAPPQYKALWITALELVDKRPFDLLTPHGQVVVQIDPKEAKSLNLKHLILYKSRKYGNTLLNFYELDEV
ncbi:MAG: 16S rRNA (guanine(966)-N(2))-methyltransferase RsmD [Chloroflexota bacterium]